MILDWMFRAYSSSARDLAEVVFGFGIIIVTIWSPDNLQHILAPIGFITTLAIAVAGRRAGTFKNGNDDALATEFGLSWFAVVHSLWILPATILLAAISMLISAKFGTLHALYKGNFKHIAGYGLWTTYQQFLLQDYFMPRLTRLISSAAAINITAILFAAAHLPNLTLTAATVIWGAVSCALFRRYRSIYVLGFVQAILGLCFAMCVPDALHHHLRVGLGYLRYQAAHAGK